MNIYSNVVILLQMFTKTVIVLNIHSVSEPLRRFRRGIVEECCRKSCSPDILELYCKPYPTDSPENVQIR